jgi:hypothetical protein
MDAEIVNNQFGLGGQQDMYDYFSRGKRRGGAKKKRIKRIIRKIRKPKRRMAAPARVPAPTPPPIRVSPARTPVPSASLPQPEEPINDMASETTSNIPYPETPPQPPVPEPEPEAEEPVEMSEEAYDYFFGKKAKQRRAARKASRVERRTERQTVRQEKRQIKNDERKAGVERLKAETQMIQQIGGSNTPVGGGQSYPNTLQANTLPAPEAALAEREGLVEDYDKKSPLEEKKNTTLWIVLGVGAAVVVGSLVWMQIEKNKIHLRPGS